MYAPATPLTVPFTIASPVYKGAVAPAGGVTVMTAAPSPPLHAEIVPSRLAKTKEALPPLTWKSLATVVIPAAPILTVPVGPCGAAPAFGIGTVSAVPGVVRGLFAATL